MKQTGEACAEMVADDLTDRGLCSETNLAHGGHRGQRAHDNLSGARPICGLDALGFEQLRVSQNDSELIIQAVKEGLEIEARPWLVGPSPA